MHSKDKGRGFGSVVILIAVASCGKAGSSTSPPGYTLVDDMEVPGGRIQWAPIGGWASGLGPGIWASSTDCKQADRISPDPYFIDPSGWSYVPVDQHFTMFGRTSEHAAHLGTKFGQALQGVWGANIGFDFAERYDADGGAVSNLADSIDAGTTDHGQECRQGSSSDFHGVPMDLSAYSGITFWAMASSHGRQAIRVQLNDVYTDPRGGECLAWTEPREKDCYNGFGKGFMLTDTFTQYWLDFSETKQTPLWAPSAFGELDKTQIYSLNFEVPLPGCNTDPNATCAGTPAAVSFDVWIDDIYFVNKPSP
jgi:hypothetical protein